MGKTILKNINKYLNLDNITYNFKSIKTKFILIAYREILNIIYPIEEKCMVCDEDGFIGICPSCKSRINKAKNEGSILSYGFYGGILKSLILKFKYESNYNVGYLLANFLIEIIKESEIDIDIICYIPMIRKDERKRGFNQCKLIANEIGYNLNIPVSNCIKKVKHTKEQKKLTKEERIKNLIGAFEVKSNEDIKNKRVLLIDDVMTTGATIGECTKILKKSGVKEIIVLTIAKSNI